MQHELMPEASPLAGARAWQTGTCAALVLLAYGLIMHAATFGNTNYFVDDSFYLLVGQRMHEGALPYVDIWDRKPFGLFAIYYLIAAVSASVIAYQIVGLLFSCATAFVIYRMVGSRSNWLGGLFAGIAYLCLMCTFDGVNGQAPVFYNLFIAGAAALVLRDAEAAPIDRSLWRIALAMILCGVALTIKQSAIVESLFLGLCVCHADWRAGMAAGRLARRAAGFALLGAAPSLMIGLAYWIGGHWPEFWHAMVTANLAKANAGLGNTAGRALSILVRIVLIAALVVWSLRSAVPQGTTRRFLTGWLAASLLGFIAIPNFFIHYALPLMVPGAVIAGFLFARPDVGRVAFVALLAFNWIWYYPFDFAETRRSNAAMSELSRLVRTHDGGGGLFVYDGPPYLYAMAGKPVLSPLVFPHHFNHATEQDTSHIATLPELDRLLSARPGVVVLSRTPRNFPVNAEAYRRVRGYVNSRCRVVGTVMIHEMGVVDPIMVFGDCR